MAAMGIAAQPKADATDAPEAEVDDSEAAVLGRPRRA